MALARPDDGDASESSKEKEASESEKCSLPPDPTGEAKKGSVLGLRELDRKTIVA